MWPRKNRKGSELASGPAVEAGPDIAGTIGTMEAPSEHPIGDTITTNPTERRAPMPANETCGNQRSYGWIWAIPATAVAIALLLIGAGAFVWLVNGNHVSNYAEGGNAYAWSSSEATATATANCGGPCQEPCNKPVRKTVSGTPVTYNNPGNPPADNPPADNPPAESGKVERTVFEFLSQPDTANETIENSGQTTAVTTPTFNQTSTTGSYTLDDW